MIFLSIQRPHDLEILEQLLITYGCIPKVQDLISSVASMRQRDYRRDVDESMREQRVL